jgi:PAS domain S-box-containing protein
MTSNNNSGYPDYSLDPFFEQTEDLLCIAGFDGYLKKVNPAFIQLLGYTKEKLFSAPLTNFIHPDDRDITIKQQNNISSGRPLLNFENRYISKKGDIIWLSWTSIPISEQELVYAIAKNITPQKKHEAERNRILTELTQTNKKLKQLNYASTHDLRSPLSSILTIFDLLDISSVEDEESKELIELLKTSISSLKKTLDKQIDRFKNNGDLQVSVEEIDIRNSFNRIKESLCSLIEDSKTTFQLNFDAFNTIKFNESYMDSIFLNLISNSIKYAHPGRAPIINITCQMHDGRKQLVFSDNGRGFDNKANEANVFALYQKFHTHTDSKGIGLYLVYNHITSLGGSISVDSTVNKGTTFTLTF